METFTKVNGITSLKNIKDMASTLGSTVMYMKVNFLKAKELEKENILSPMETHMRESSKMIYIMDLAY